MNRLIYHGSLNITVWTKHQASSTNITQMPVSRVKEHQMKLILIIKPANRQSSIFHYILWIVLWMLNLVCKHLNNSENNTRHNKKNDYRQFSLFIKDCATLRSKKKSKSKAIRLIHYSTLARCWLLLLPLYRKTQPLKIEDKIN